MMNLRWWLYTFITLSIFPLYSYILGYPDLKFYLNKIGTKINLHT